MNEELLKYQMSLVAVYMQTPIYSVSIGATVPAQDLLVQKTPAMIAKQFQLTQKFFDTVHVCLQCGYVGRHTPVAEAEISMEGKVTISCPTCHKHEKLPQQIEP